MVRVKILIIILAAAAVFWGFNEYRLGSKASATPQKMSCAELIAKGPGKNVNILLTDFVACPAWYVYETNSKSGGENGPYTKVYMPALELNGEWHRQAMAAVERKGKNAELPRPRDIRLMLKLKHMANEDEILRTTDADTMQGMIINAIESITGEDRRLLRQGYPTLNVDNCLIFEVGRKPTSTAAAMGGIVGGAAGILFALAWLILPKLRGQSPRASLPSLEDAHRAGMARPRDGQVAVPTGKPGATLLSPSKPAQDDEADVLADLDDKKNPYRQ